MKPLHYTKYLTRETRQNDGPRYSEGEGRAMDSLSFTRKCCQKLKGQTQKIRRRSNFGNQEMPSDMPDSHTSNDAVLDRSPERFEANRSFLPADGRCSPSKVPSILVTPPSETSGAGSDDGFKRHTINTPRWKGEVTEELFCSSQDEGQDDRIGVYSVRMRVEYKREKRSCGSSGRLIERSGNQDTLKVPSDDRNRERRGSPEQRPGGTATNPSSPTFWLLFA